jgi:uncharacterized protein (TIGR00725 family)
MEAAAYGAKQKGGTTLGILPGVLIEEANPWIDLAVVSGMGHARNALIAQSADVLIAKWRIQNAFRDSSRPENEKTCNCT